MKLTYNEVKEAAKLEAEGKDLTTLATIYDVHYSTMARYLRAYARYGKSFWGVYRTEVDDESHIEQRHQASEE